MERKMTKVYKILLILILIFTVSCGQTALTTGDSADDTVTDDSLSDDKDDGSGTATTIGNPSWTDGDLFADAQVYLILDTADADYNFKMLVDDEVEAVFNESDDSSDFPQVDYLVQGTDSEIGLVLKESVSLNDEDCSAILYQDESSDPKCLMTDTYALNDTLQFNPLGSVFLHRRHSSTDVDELVQVDASSLEEVTLVNQNTSLDDWQAHANGDVYLIGESGGSSSFQRINASNGSVENLVAGGDTVSDFILVDQNHLIYQDDDSNYLLTTGGADEGSIEELDFAEGDLSSAKKDSLGLIYVANDSDIYRLYPDTPTEVELDLDDVISFQIINDYLYVIGEQDGDPVFLQKDLLDDSLAVNLLGEQNIQLYHFSIYQNHVYFNGLRFADNEIILAKINLSNGSISELESYEEAFIQMQTKGKDYYDTYTDVEDLRDE
jgi:hypothetical protein